MFGLSKADKEEKHYSREDELLEMPVGRGEDIVFHAQSPLLPPSYAAQAIAQGLSSQNLPSLQPVLPPSYLLLIQKCREIGIKVDQLPGVFGASTWTSVKHSDSVWWHYPFPIVAADLKEMQVVQGISPFTKQPFISYVLQKNHQSIVVTLTEAISSGKDSVPFLPDQKIRPSNALARTYIRGGQVKIEPLESLDEIIIELLSAVEHQAQYLFGIGPKLK